MWGMKEIVTRRQVVDDYVCNWVVSLRRRGLMGGAAFEGISGLWFDILDAL